MNKSKCISHMHGPKNFHQEGGVAVFDEEVCMGFHVRHNNIGIEHDFYTLTSVGVQEWR